MFVDPDGVEEEGASALPWAWLEFGSSPSTLTTAEVEFVAAAEGFPLVPFVCHEVSFVSLRSRWKSEVAELDLGWEFS